ncbi:MAG: flavodoxin family protein [Anaerolineales bacterium]|nr:flavodoxin family protein [Anaerolineales bacterium]
MKALIIYDSGHGNTEKIAQAIGEGLESHADVKVKKVDEVRAGDLIGNDYLMVGSPTHGFNPTPAVSDMIKGIAPGGLKGVKVAAFDTRFPDEKIGENRILKFFVGLFGFAAGKIANKLVKKGGVLAVPTEGFYVADTEGPLLEGELERAKAWAIKIVGRP